MYLYGTYDRFTGHLVSLWLVLLAVAVALWFAWRRRAERERQAA